MKTQMVATKIRGIPGALTKPGLGATQPRGTVPGSNEDCPGERWWGYSFSDPRPVAVCWCRARGGLGRPRAGGRARALCGGLGWAGAGLGAGAHILQGVAGSGVANPGPCGAAGMSSEAKANTRHIKGRPAHLASPAPLGTAARPPGGGCTEPRPCRRIPRAPAIQPMRAGRAPGEETLDIPV